MPDSEPVSSILAVRVHPRSSKIGHEVRDDGFVHVWVGAAAVDGAANREMLKYLAGLLRAPVSRIEIVTGHAAKTKHVRVPLAADKAAVRIQTGQINR